MSLDMSLGPVWVVRRAWSGDRAPRSSTPLSLAEAKGLAIHYSGSAADVLADHSQCADRVRAIRDFHMDVRGWAFIAYNWVVCVHGYIFEGRGIGVRSAAQGTAAGNDGFHAVCFLGNDRADRADVTPAAKVAILEVQDDVLTWCAHATEVRGHGWFKATDCPGSELESWIVQGLPDPRDEEVLDVTEERLRQIVGDEVDRVYRLLARGEVRSRATGQWVVSDTPAHRDYSLRGLRLLLLGEEWPAPAASPAADGGGPEVQGLPEG